MRTSSSVDKSLLKFFLLVFVLSVPFWLLDGLTQLPKEVPINLPVSSLMACNPLIAALILTYRYNKSAGMKKLLKRAFDYKRIKENRWYVPIIFLMPAMMFLAYWLMILMGLPLPEPHIPNSTLHDQKSKQTYFYPNFRVLRILTVYHRFLKKNDLVNCDLFLMIPSISLTYQPAMSLI